MLFVLVTNCLHTVVVAYWQSRHLELALPGFRSWWWHPHLSTLFAQLWLPWCLVRARFNARMDKKCPSPENTTQNLGEAYEAKTTEFPTMGAPTQWLCCTLGICGALRVLPADRYILHGLDAVPMLCRALRVLPVHHYLLHALDAWCGLESLPR